MTDEPAICTLSTDTMHCPGCQHPLEAHYCPICEITVLDPHKQYCGMTKEWVESLVKER